MRRLSVRGNLLALICRTLVEMAHQAAQVVGLLQGTFAHLDDVAEILANLSQEFLTNAGLTSKQPEQGVIGIYRPALW